MSKQIYFLTSFVLVVCLAGNTWAGIVTWDNNLGAGNRLWDDADNWYTSGSPGAPTANDDAVIDDQYTDADNGPIIQDGMSAVCSSLTMGETATPSVEAVLTMTGGTLDAGSTVYIGDDTPGRYRFDMSGGTLTLGSHFRVGHLEGTNGTLNMSGGSIVGNANFYIAYDYNSVGTVNMTGGSISIPGYFDMPEQGAAQATLNMDGGSIMMLDDWYVSYEGDVNCTVNMTDGYIYVGEDLEFSEYDNASGYINISGGTIEIADDIYLGWVQSGPAIINMTGGTINCTSELNPLTDGVSWLEIAASDGGGGGHLHMGGGTLSAYSMSMSTTASMSITYGTLIFDQDLTVTNGYFWDPEAGNYDGTLMGLARQGVITVFDTNHGDIITDDVNFPDEAGKRAVLKVDYDGTNASKTTVTANAVEPNLAWSPTPSDGAGGLVATEVDLLSWEAGDNAASHDVYFGTSFTEVNEADTSSATFKGNQPLADANYAVSNLQWGTPYYWRIDELGSHPDSPWRGEVWSFTTVSAKAKDPSPYDGADGVSPTVVLSWTEGPEADTHELYLSTNFNDVNERLITPATPPTNSYNPGGLEFSTTYYWVVDEVNLAADVNVWPGDVWQFTTGEHLTVDDFDSYVSDTALWAVWDDYWTNGTGSEIFVEKAENLTYDGNSLKFVYVNTYSHGGEQVGSRADADIADLEIGADWAAAGVKAMRLVFLGQPGNSATENDRMWVELEDTSSNSGVARYDGDPNDIKDEDWHEWHIDLGIFDVCGVSLSNVDKVHIGFGGPQGGQDSKTPGGSGTVYFDSLEVWPPYCRTEMVASDVTDDCVTNMDDLEVVFEDWLVRDYNVIATVPNEANLLGWWKFDEGAGTTTADSSAYGNDGNILEASWTTGYPDDPCDSALDFDGDGASSWDRVVVVEREGNSPGTYPAELMPSDAFTVACWVKIRDFGYFDAFVCNTEDTGDDECGFALYNGGWYGETGNDFGFMLRTMGTGMYYLETENIGETDIWYHVAGVYDGEYATIYLDASETAGPAYVGGPMRWVSAELGNYPGAFIIGAYVDRDEFHPVDGIIDEVRYYDYALSLVELEVLAGLVAPGTDVYKSVPSPANVIDPEPPLSRSVNLYDYGVIADHWLEGPTLWPQP